MLSATGFDAVSNVSANAQLWNGLGGKIEGGETPLASVQREMQEEASIDLSEVPSLFFAGIITWGPMSRGPVRGMYAFIAHLSQHQAERVRELPTPVGLITWKPLAWVCDPNNRAVVSNIPHLVNDLPCEQVLPSKRSVCPNLEQPNH